MFRTICRRVTIAVESGFKWRLRITADRWSDEDSISPNDRARVCEAGNRCAPEDVLACLTVPLVRKILSFGNAGRIWTTKRWPASFVACNRASGWFAVAGTDDLARRFGNNLIWRSPRTAIEDHLPHPAIVRYETEGKVLAVSFVAILAWAIAAARSAGHQELNIGAEVFIGTVDLGPAGAFECERARGIETSCKNSKVQRLWR